MILTVTPNSAIDQTVFVNAFRKNTTMRATHSILSMAGKAADASFILATLGYPTLATGFAAGAIGEIMERMLRQRGATSDFVQVNGETRLHTILVDESDHTASTLTVSTLQVLPEHVEQLLQKCDEQLKHASVLIAGGTLPKAMKPEFYADLIRLARSHAVPVIFDTVEPFLSAGLSAGPTYIKPNKDELAQFAGHEVTTLQEAQTIGQSIYQRFGAQSIITLGGEGALAVLAHVTYWIPPLAIDVVSPAGAGDAVLAGLAASIERQEPIEEGLRLGIAAAAAVCLMPGTADCRPEDVARLRNEVRLERYTGETVN
ncbi:MAG: 1-phosphofructokinase family hexose kinase [Caldilineaceae bacterium]